jgi:hypothetical protein
VRIFRHRAGRERPRDEAQLFEELFIGLYDTVSGELLFFDVNVPPLRSGRPAVSLSYDDLLKRIGLTYDRRNDPPFEWADSPK